MGGMPMMPMGGPMPGAEDIERKSKRPAPPQDDFFGADLPPYADVEKLVDPDAVL